MPFPVDEARTLRVRLRPGSDAAGFEDDGSPAYQVLVHLELSPPGGFPDERWASPPAKAGPPPSTRAAGADHAVHELPPTAQRTEALPARRRPSPRSAHERQRELVRASLLACPTVKGTTHRRAA